MGDNLLYIATLLWDANNASQSFSRCYDAEWVNKLYRGVARNLTRPFKFILFTDRWRDVDPHIAQRRMMAERPSYSDCIEPYALDRPMILMGLDTVITGNIDHLADYCLTADVLALPRDPYNKAQACNGVCLVPAGHGWVYDSWRGENDMDWLRKVEHVYIEDVFGEGDVVSWKGHVERRGLGKASVVYFHGQRKPHQLKNNPIISEHWR